MGIIFKQLNFLLTATNQHGVHSPFVYKFVTECLYTSRKKKHKTIDVLFKSISYFETKSLLLTEAYSGYTVEIQKKFPLVRFGSPPYDLFLIDASVETEIRDLIANPTSLHNNTMLLIDRIHKNSKNESVWQAVKASPNVTVTIDLFYCGVVFFRKEQVKEHFKIRI